MLTADENVIVDDSFKGIITLKAQIGWSKLSCTASRKLFQDSAFELSTEIISAKPGKIRSKFKSFQALNNWVPNDILNK